MKVFGDSSDHDRKKAHEKGNADVYLYTSDFKVDSSYRKSGMSASEHA